jgi:hypothetical protein
MVPCVRGFAVAVMKATAADAAVVKALVFRTHALAGEGPLWPATTELALLSLLLNLRLYDLSSLHDRPSFGHVLLHEPKALIFLAKVCQLVLNDGFNFILRVLMLIFLNFDFLVWVLIVLL